MDDELLFGSASDLAGLIRDREVSVVEVVGAHLDRIDEMNPRVNAIVSARGREEIMADARSADMIGADGNEQLGPLHGLPVAIKDLDNVAGLPTRSGSLTTSPRPAKSDGLVTQRLRAAGCVIVGKTNTPEFGTGSHTFNEVFGTTRNPWNLERSAGGSSGGAAAALASGMIAIADGSDFGGSLRNPAAFCNVVGLRPSIGRVPSLSDRSRHILRLGVKGPMGRTVADTALVLSVLAGPHPRDPVSMATQEDLAAPLPTSTGASLAWAGDLGLFAADPEVLRVCETAARQITDAGGEFNEDRPDLSEAMAVFRVLRGLNYRDLGAQIPRDRWKLVKRTVIENIEYGQTLDVDDVLAAERSRVRIHDTMTEFFQNHEVLALPSAQVLPFPVEQEYPTTVAGQQMRDYLEWMTTCCVITVTGCPAISIPAGLSEDGLPVGLQLVAPIGAERRLLEIAQSLEAVLPNNSLAPSTRK